MPHSHPEDRSALHLDMLAERLAESTDGDARDHAREHANTVSLAIHPADARDVRGVTDVDHEVVSLLEHIITHKFAGLALHETVRASVHCDAIGDVVQRLVRSAVAFRLAGNEHPALEQWALATNLLFGATPPFNPRPDTAKSDAARALCKIFGDAGYAVGEVSVTYSTTGPDATMHPRLMREPGPHEMLLIAGCANDISLATFEAVSLTHGTRSIHMERGDATALLQFTVDGDDEGDQ